MMIHTWVHSSTSSRVLLVLIYCYIAQFCWQISALEFMDMAAESSSISCGVHHTCAIQHNPLNEYAGPISCWGNNDHGQTDPPEVCSFQTCNFTVACSADLHTWHCPHDLKGNYVQLACGATFCCALRDDEHVECWGAGITIQGSFIQASHWISLFAHAWRWPLGKKK